MIGTEGTVRGGAYQAAIRRLEPASRVTARACPLFVALAEEGWTEGAIAEAVARRYLDPLFAGADAARHAGAGLHAFSGAERADPRGPAGSACPSSIPRPPRRRAVARELDSAAAGGGGAVTWLATDGAARFARVGGIFLGQALRADEIEIVDLWIRRSLAGAQS